MRFAATLCALASLIGAPSAWGATKCHLGQMAELPVRMSNASPLVTAKVNGVDTTFIADTGAFFSLLLPESAKRLGLKEGPAPFGIELEGLTGKTDVSLAHAKDFTLLSLTLHNVDFLVAGHDLGEADGLLGQNLLGFADMEYDLGNGAIRFFKAEDCNKVDLAYWAEGRPYTALDIPAIRISANQIRSEAEVDGVRVHVLFDTGTPRSILRLSVAKRVGVKFDDPAVTPAGGTSGIGGRLIETWIAPFKKFTIGGEQVQNTKLRVGDFNAEDIDMILGADFFLSHRIFVAKSQSRIYFTYNGGPVFDLAATHGRPAPGPAPSPAGAAGVASAEPTDAAGFSRRGDAFVSRQQYTQAIADFSHAVALEPTDPKHLHDRAMAFWRNGDQASARADLDAALKLKPADASYLMERGALRLQVKDDAGARADFDAAEQADPSQRASIAYDYESNSRFEAAVAEYDKLVASQAPGDDLAQALNNRCWARGLWGKQLEEALNDCNQALKLKPGFAPYLDSRGLIELRLGRLDLAIADYDAVLHKTPQNVWSLYGRGLAEQRLGQKAKASADMAAATALAPGMPTRMKALGIAP
jgi:tetratricopeptide (TPR) repeat protein/predicted aspartyl protease